MGCKHDHGTSNGDGECLLDIAEAALREGHVDFERYMTRHPVPLNTNITQVTVGEGNAALTLADGTVMDSEGEVLRPRDPVTVAEAALGYGRGELCLVSPSVIIALVAATRHLTPTLVTGPVDERGQVTVTFKDLTDEQSAVGRAVVSELYSDYDGLDELTVSPRAGLAGLGILDAARHAAEVAVHDAHGRQDEAREAGLRVHPVVYSSYGMEGGHGEASD